jgi:hypothetical protein
VPNVLSLLKNLETHLLEMGLPTGLIDLALRAGVDPHAILTSFLKWEFSAAVDWLKQQAAAGQTLS